MTIRECYEEFGGNYDEALGRLGGREALVQRFALKFLDDKSFKELDGFLAEGNVQEAFRAAHTLKGVCANLSFTRLFESADEITELLRVGQFDDAMERYPSLCANYVAVTAALEKLKA